MHINSYEQPSNQRSEVDFREMVIMARFSLPFSYISSSSSCNAFFHPQSYPQQHHAIVLSEQITPRFHNPTTRARIGRRNTLLWVGKDDINTELRVQENQDQEEPEDQDQYPPSLQDLQYVLELLKKNRDMLFNEVKLTIMIEDPREVERRRVLGIEDPDAPTRNDLVEAFEQVNEGKVPKNRVALQMLAEEMINWPNLEVEVPKKKPSKSLYAKVTDTGINPQEAAKRLKIDWDSAAEIDDSDVSGDAEVPPAVGYGALYLVTAFLVIIGISVVIILLYNSLQ